MAKSWTGTGSASVVALRPMMTFARTRGVEVEALLHEIGLSASALDDYDHRIPEAARARMWIEAAEQSRDPSFGLHVAERSQVGAYDVLDYSLYFSSTLREAIERLMRFHRVLCDAWAFKFTVQGGAVRLRRVERTPPAEAEAVFAGLTLRARALTQAGAPREVRFAHAAPADTAPHEAMFQCPVRFGRPASEIVFDAKDLALPVRTANPGVDRILDRYMTEILERLPKNESFVERARAAVSRTLRSAPPTLERTARELHASPRTLQRKLAEQGSSHSEVVDSVRREMAERLVADSRVSITEIAFLLGFTDVSGFRRMYKRWTGVSPARTRSDSLVT
jgi:AraC-like DNA-binding protein